MEPKIKIAVDAMGGENSPRKIIDGILENHKKNEEVIYNIFGDKEKIEKYLPRNYNIKVLGPNKIVSQLRVTMYAIKDLKLHLGYSNYLSTSKKKYQNRKRLMNLKISQDQLNDQELK